MNLINREEFAFVESFLNADPPHSFQEYGDLIEKYDSLAKSILLEYDQTAFIGLFEIHKRSFMEQLSEAAKFCKEMVVNKVTHDYQIKCKT